MFLFFFSFLVIFTTSVCLCFAEQVVKQDYEVIIMVSPALLVLDVRR